MAMMTELAQRMLTKRPTVALMADRPSWLAARSPTRAREPRTEITRPKDVTVVEPGMSRMGIRTAIMQAAAGETVKPGYVGLRKIRGISVRVWCGRSIPALRQRGFCREKEISGGIGRLRAGSRVTSGLPILQGTAVR